MQPTTQANKPPNQSALMNWLEGMTTQTNMPSIIKEFVHSGERPSDLLMRTVFQNVREVNVAVILLMKFERFRMPKRFDALVLNKLAGNPSVGGGARKELLQAASQVVVGEYITGKQKTGGGEDKYRKGGNADREQ